MVAGDRDNVTISALLAVGSSAAFLKLAEGTAGVFPYPHTLLTPAPYM